MPPHVVNSQFLQDWFNGLRVEELIDRGVFRERVHTEGAPSVHANQPPGTSSQIRRAYDSTGLMMAECHCYRLPDGSIGASGMRDPKGLRLNGEWYYCLP